jgi:hypothetical protein
MHETPEGKWRDEDPRERKPPAYSPQELLLVLFLVLYGGVPWPPVAIF